MDDERLAEIRARCEAATPGPWRVEVEDWTEPGEPELCWLDGPGWVDEGSYEDYSFFSRQDAEFCAHARTDIPDMLAELARLREVERKAIAQAEDVQRNWLGPGEAEGLRQELARLRERVAVLERDSGICPWCHRSRTYDPLLLVIHHDDGAPSDEPERSQLRARADLQRMNTIKQS